MSPLKNTDKHLSDYLPPALVKDWRQCFRSRSALLIFILLELAGWLIFFCFMADADKTPSEYLESLRDMGEMLWSLAIFALCVAIPYRAGSTVAADTKERSANFLMLTPLSARRIVWGTWSSTALVLLLAAVCALPLLAARQLMFTAYPHIGELNPAAYDWDALGADILVLGWVVLCGWATTALYMFAAGLSRIMRGGLIACCCLMAFVSMVEPSHLMRELFFQTGQKHPSPILVSLCVTDVILLILLFLELARRHYAAPAENCSRSVRLLAPLPYVSFGLLLCIPFLGLAPIDPDAQAVFALMFALGALLADVLLPTYNMPTQGGRFWCCVPRWLQKPGIAPSAVILAFFSLLFCLPELISVYDGEMHFLASGDSLVKHGVEALNFGFTLLFWLLITDMLCKRSSNRRPVVFCLVALACSFVAGCIHVPLESLDLWVAASSLPLAGTQISYELGRSGMDALMQAACLNGGAMLFCLLLLVLWRGRINKA